MDTKFKAVDFFCGGGGLTEGFKQSGVNVVAGIDIDKDCEETYKANHPETNFINVDISELDFITLERLGIKKNDPQMIFAGCAPCQYWSLIRTSKSKSEKTKNLINDFYMFVEYFQPGYLVIENVPGLAKNNESPIHTFKNRISSLGYIIKDAVVNTVDYGIPQNRKRYILIASNHADKLALPEKEEIIVTVKDVLGSSNGFKQISAGYFDDTEFMHTCRKLSEKNKMRLMRTQKDGGNRLAWKNDEQLQLKAYEGKDNLFKDVYARLYWNKPAPTITTKFTSISNGRFSHPEEDRGLSIREGATLQSFPKSYKFQTKSISVASKIIGNAVPPKLARLISKTITKR